MLNSQSSSSNSTNSTSSRDKTVHTKSDAKNKHGKVIHKFTSESYLRIICEKSSSTKSSNNDKKLLLVDKSSSSSSGHVPMSSNTIINSMNNMSKRKGTSFQITSVSVSSGNNQQPQSQQQRDNNGDDSADDLDESHTDDNISRITDYETPSFSEDTFSREDVFFAQPNALGTAPVIPTSSQYGLAIVGPDLSGNGANLSDVHVSVSDAGINIMGQLPNKQDDHKNERFKVVKIESTEPFKRGRWMCMDYLDHTTLQAQDDGIDGSPKEDGDENVVRTKDSGLELGMEGSEMNDNCDMEHDNEGLDQEVMRAEMMNHHGGDGHHSQASHEHQHHHTMTSIPIHNENHLGAQQSQAQSMPQGHIQQIISPHEKPNESSSRGEMNPSSDTLPTQASQAQPSNFVGGANQQHTFAADNNSPMIPHHAQSMTPDMIQRSLQLEQQAHNQQQMQGVTLPANILMRNLGLDQHHQHGNASSHQATSSPLPTQGENAGEMENRQQHQPPQDSQTSQFQNQQVGAGDNKHQPANESEQASGASTNDNLINNSVSDMNNMNSNDGTQNTLSPSSSAGLGTVAEGGSAVGGGASELNSNNASNAAAPGADDGQSIAEDSERWVPIVSIFPSVSSHLVLCDLFFSPPHRTSKVAKEIKQQTFSSLLIFLHIMNALCASTDS